MWSIHVSMLVGVLRRWLIHSLSSPFGQVGTLTAELRGGFPGRAATDTRKFIDDRENGLDFYGFVVLGNFPFLPTLGTSSLAPHVCVGHEPCVGLTTHQGSTS